MELNGPAKRLFIDYEDQDQRQQGAEDQANAICHEAKQTCFTKNDSPDLRLSSTQETQDRKFAPPVNHYSEQRSRDPQHGNDYRHGLERVSDAERPIKYSNGFAPEPAVCKNH